VGPGGLQLLQDAVGAAGRRHGCEPGERGGSIRGAAGRATTDRFITGGVVWPNPAGIMGCAPRASLTPSEPRDGRRAPDGTRSEDTGMQVQNDISRGLKRTIEEAAESWKAHRRDAHGARDVDYLVRECLGMHQFLREWQAEVWHSAFANAVQ